MADEAPPPEWFTRARWVRPQDAEWAVGCNKILLEHGAITGRTVYERRHVARWRGRRLINLLVSLKLHERWQLREHTDRKDGGFVWTVEYLGGPHARPANPPDPGPRRAA